MTIFIREFRRIYSVRRMVVIACMLIMSCVLYFNEQSGNVLYKQYSEVMERPDYEKIDWMSVGSGVTRLIQEREMYVADYTQNISQIISQAEKNLEIGIFSQKGSFSYHNQKKVIDDFTGLLEVTPEVINDSAVRTVFSYNYQIFFMLAAMVTIVAALDLNGKKSLGVILYAAPNGRYRLGVSRVIIICVSAMLISVLFTTAHILVGFGIYGGADILTKPIQSIPEFAQFKYTVNIRQALVMYEGFMAGGLAVIGLFIWLVLSIFKNMTVSVIIMAVLAGIEFLFFNLHAQSPILVLKYANILSLVMCKSRFPYYINVNVFNQSVGEMAVSGSFAGCMLIINSLLCVYVSGTRVLGTDNIFTRLGDKLEHAYNALTARIPAGGIALYSFLIKNKGILVLAFVTVIMFNNSRTVTAQYSIVAKIKCEMYEDMSGLDSEGKRQYLQEIFDEYSSLREQLTVTGERFAAGEATIEEYYSVLMMLSAMSEKVNAALEIQEQLNMLDVLYEQRGIRGTLVNEAAYSYLIGRSAFDAEELNLVCLYLCIILFAALVFAYDDEKNTRAVIISTPNGRTGYYVKKLVMLSVVNVIMCVAESLIFGMNIVGVYGLEHIGAYVQSLSWMTQYPFKINMLTYIILTVCYRIIFFEAIILIISGVAVMYGRFVGVVVGIAGLMPYLILQLGVQVAEPLSIIKYLQYSGYQSGVVQCVFSGIAAGVFLAGGAVCTRFGTANWRRLKKR